MVVTQQRLTDTLCYSAFVFLINGPSRDPHDLLSVGSKPSAHQYTGIENTEKLNILSKVTNQGLANYSP